jgi:drug/metabolite transporter (DMT)-like permease
MNADLQSAAIAMDEVTGPSPERTAPRSSAAAGVRVELLVFASVVLGAAGQLLLKAALLLLSLPPSARIMNLGPEWACVAGVALGLGVYAIGTLFWVRSVSRASISYLYPLSASSYAIVALGGHLLFGESVHFWRWAGIAVMSAGVALLAMTAERSTA